ncbi:uncharacterized protein BXIN_1373 [Babesia sp. Xinjiang]|uniref:uncharacterized protein n=1 Tax=Babesia sp. Xinjiang TaxID=462227 RepID=UPI000A22C695|nr:uncharacterized protein BXIN_1373 [Babesia sp. Xinjiang]ORM40228.1 hypothetical protein BXIN_1373 [Babesia sp. Xinjiang]
MTDYWVSTKKHYCEVCRCWITGSALNIKNHESSARHISELRKKLIESHRRQVAKKEQDDFEAEEIARLNSVTIDGPAINETSTSSSLPSSSLFRHNRVLNPPVDKEREQQRLMAALSRALSGQPQDDPETNRNTTWMAFIDQEDGTLTYYNNVTGVKTKVRPRDFDGVLPTTSSSLTSNWALKYDPTKQAKYYQNLATGEIRWIDQPSSGTTSRHSENDRKLPLSTLAIKTEHVSSEQSSSKSPSQIRIKLEPKDDDSVSVPVQVKREPEDEPSVPHTESRREEPPKQYAAPEIGEWEVVKPEDSVFSHSIVSIEPYLEPPAAPVREPDIFDVIREATYETPLLNVDDMQLQEKQVFFKHKNLEGTDPADAPVQFAKRKLPKKK